MITEIQISLPAHTPPKLGDLTCAIFRETFARGRTVTWAEDPSVTSETVSAEVHISAAIPDHVDAGEMVRYLTEGIAEALVHPLSAQIAHAAALRGYPAKRITPQEMRKLFSLAARP